MRPVISVSATGPHGPVALARVVVELAPGPMPDIAGLTAQDGTFTMGTVGPGRYVLAVHADGFTPARTEVTVGPRDVVVPMTVVLHPEGRTPDD
jgi:hypothetical protein